MKRKGTQRDLSMMGRLRRLAPAALVSGALAVTGSPADAAEGQRQPVMPHQAESTRAPAKRVAVLAVTPAGKWALYRPVEEKIPHEKADM